MKLREWRKNKGYTLRQVAAMLDISSPSTVHDMEKYGVKKDSRRTDLKRISLGEISNFDGENDG